MTERLDLAGQAETSGIDVAQKLVGEGYILFQSRFDFLDIGILAHQIEDANNLRLPGVKRPGRSFCRMSKKPARGGIHPGVKTGLKGWSVIDVECLSLLHI